MKKRQTDEKGDSFWPQMLQDLLEVLRLSCKYSSRESYIHVAFFSPLNRALLLLLLASLIHNDPDSGLVELACGHPVWRTTLSRWLWPVLY